MGNLWLVKCDGLILQPMALTNYKFPIIGGKFMVCVDHRLQYQTIAFYQPYISHHRFLSATETRCRLPCHARVSILLLSPPQDPLQ